MELKVCHVTATLDSGGIERWLLNVNNQQEELKGVHLDFMTLLGTGGQFVAGLKAKGSCVFHVPFRWRSLFSSVALMTRYFREGKYDVVHSHLDYMSAVVFVAARLAGVPVLINHIHKTVFPEFEERSAKERIAGRMLRLLCFWLADLHIGCSTDALKAFVGADQSKVRSIVHFCGTPLVKDIQHGETLRRSLGLQPDDQVAVHVGRHVAEKRVSLLLQAFRQISGENSRLHLVLIGMGPDSEKLKQDAGHLLGHRIHFLGYREDVQALLAVSDIFVLPSRFEGLPVSMLEAQARGLPCLVSDSVTREADVIASLIHRLPSGASVSEWANEMQRLLASRSAMDPASAYQIFEQSPFNLTREIELLCELYVQLVSGKSES